MVDAVVRLFNMAIEHRAVACKAERVGGAMNLEPLSGIGLVFTDSVADFRVKYLRSAAR